MEKRKPGLLLSLLLLAGTVVAFTPGSAGAAVPAAPYDGPPSTIGTDFWTSFGANNSIPPDDYIDLSGNTATTATVAVPGTSFSQDVTITPGTVATVDVTGADMTSPDGIQDLGIHITAGAPVSVYGLEDLVYSTDGFTALPTTAIGTEYYALGYDSTGEPSAQPSDFQVVGTQDGTTVTVTPSQNTASRTAGVPYTISLDAGQVYELIGTSGLDLTGTKITSTAPVSVLAGTQCANIPSGDYGACNYIAEQMPPTNEWGTDFVTEPLATRTEGDTFRMLASQDGTVVSVDGTVVATLDAGHFFQTQLTAASVIHASGPILVAQYSDGTDFDGANADPSETLVPPDEQFLNTYTVATAPDPRFTDYLNVVAPTNEVGSVTLDGTAIPSNLFAPIGTSAFSGAQVPVSIGSHTLSGPQAFGLISYGFGTTDAYSEPGGYGAGQVANAASLTLAPPSQFPPVGQQACVTATVEDVNQQPLSGIGVSFTVTGTNPTNGFASTQSNGQAQFCYTGNAAGADVVTATSGSLSATANVDFGGTAPGHDAVGYRLQGRDGGVFDYGNSLFYGSLPGRDVSAPIISTANTYDNGGYWLAGSDGSIFAFGDANYYGGLFGNKLNAPIVGIAGTPDMGGYWLVAADGGVFAFGDAAYYGSMGGMRLNKAIVGMAASPDGKGYWLVASDGGIFAFGDAKFHGSMGGKPLNKPIVGMWPTNDGRGYWLAASDGGVFALGDANYFGSASGVKLAGPVVGIVADPSNAGYWLMGSDGGVFAYGDAPFFGAASTFPPSPLNKPITSSST